MISKTKTPLLFLGLLVSLLYMLFYAYDYFLQTSFSILPQSFIIKHGITTESFGFLSAAFFYGYVIFQIPLGYCLDKISLKYTAILCAACCALGTALFHYADSFSLLFLARFMIGAGTACACVMSVYAVSMWLSPRYFFIGVGAVQVAGCLGSIFGQAIGAYFTAHFGWDFTIHLIIYIGIALLLIYCFIPKKSPYQNVIEEPVHFTQLPKLILNKQIIIIALLGFVSWAPVSVLAATWLVRLLHQGAGQWTESDAATLLSAFWIGLAIASLLIGKFSNYIKSRKKTVAIAFIVQGICAVLLASRTNLTPIQLGAILFLLGAAASVQTLSFVLTAESINLTVYGTAAALVNMTAASSGGVINPIFGIIIAHTGSYQSALWVFPALSLIGIVMALFALKETYADTLSSSELIKAEYVE